MTEREFSFDIASQTGNPSVAEVFVGQSKKDSSCFVELVDGLSTGNSRDEKWIINISTQYGCAVKCLTCDAGLEFHGNVPTEAMLDQVRFVAGRYPPELSKICKKLKIHFSRMGEPALNPDVPEAIAALPKIISTFGLWACVATIFPAGRENWFRDIKQVKGEFFHRRFQLQFSINSTDEDWRKRLIPFNCVTPDEMSDFGNAFFSPGDRKIVLNFLVAKGVPIETSKLRRIFNPEIFMVKLTPLNPTKAGRDAGLETMFTPVDPKGVELLANDLGASGFDVVVSIGDPREDEIGSNCGQAVLRLKSNEKS